MKIPQDAANEIVSEILLHNYHTTAQCKPEIHSIEWDRIA